MKLWQRPVLRVYFEKPLDEEAIHQAFRVGETTPWFVAVCQLIAQYRDEAMAAAATHVATGNNSAAAASIGAVDSLGQVLTGFKELRESATKKVAT